jgi:hypothetical protein
MDFTVEFPNQPWTFRARSQKARKWCEKNAWPAAGFAVPAQRGPMTWRALQAEDFNLVPEVSQAEGRRDFDEQYSDLVITRAKRIHGGSSQEALEDLVMLRRQNLMTMDPKNRGLLVEIDRELAAAHESCRTDRPQPNRANTAVKNGGVISWIRRATRDLERALIYLALVVVFTVEVYRFVASVV